MKMLPFLVLLALPSLAFPRDAARDLRRMVGYTIIKADHVWEAREAKSGGGVVKLSDGSLWKVDSMILMPLMMTDVVCFAKKLPLEILANLPPKTPEIRTYSIKILIDNEVFDAVQLE
jgi:hypothetical protein